MQGILGRLKSVNRLALIVVVLALIVVVALVFVLNPSRPPVLAQAEPETVRVISGDLTGEVVASGLLIPQRDVHLSMGASGIVEEVNVKVGDLVKEGDVLIRLDDVIAQENANKAELAVQLAQVKVETAQHDYNVRIGWTPNQNQVNSAQAALANAEATVKAAQSAYDQVQYLPGVSSTQQSLNLEQATNNYNKAKADLAYLYSNRPDVIIALNNLEAAKLALSSAESDQRAAKEALARMTLIAPFDGTITAVTVDIGEATTGPVAELVTMDLLDVVLDIDEVDIGTLHLNDPAIVTFDAWPGLQVDAKVISIAPKANATANVVNFEVHLALEDSDLDLRAGMTANAVIKSFTVKDALLAPNEAIFLDPESGYFVYLVTPDGAQKIAVVIGERGDQNTQILSGVSPGDKLLITEPRTLLP